MQNCKQRRDKEIKKLIALPYLAFTVWVHGNIAYY